jgi:hypothetical protein
MTKLKEKPYYTNSRARRAISLVDTSDQNSISYDEDTGVLSFTGLSNSNIRSAISAGTGVDVTDGVISIGQSVGTTDNVTFGTVSVDLITSDMLTLNAGSEPVSPINGNIAMADGSTWNPNADGTQALMIYINDAWVKIV